MNKLKNGKRPSADNIVDEIMKADARIMAEVVEPITFFFKKRGYLLLKAAIDRISMAKNQKLSKKKNIHARIEPAPLH